MTGRDGSQDGRSVHDRGGAERGLVASMRWWIFQSRHRYWMVQAIWFAVATFVFWTVMDRGLVRSLFFSGVSALVYASLMVKVTYRTGRERFVEEVDPP